jgi:hypothetical protein
MRQPCNSRGQETGHTRDSQFGRSKPPAYYTCYWHRDELSVVLVTHHETRSSEVESHANLIACSPINTRAMRRGVTGHDSLLFSDNERSMRSDSWLCATRAQSATGPPYRARLRRPISLEIPSFDSALRSSHQKAPPCQRRHNIATHGSRPPARM